MSVTTRIVLSILAIFCFVIAFGGCGGDDTAKDPEGKPFPLTPVQDATWYDAAHGDPYYGVLSWCDGKGHRIFQSQPFYGAARPAGGDVDVIDDDDCFTSGAAR